MTVHKIYGKKKHFCNNFGKENHFLYIYIGGRSYAVHKEYKQGLWQYYFFIYFLQSRNEKAAVE